MSIALHDTFVRDLPELAVRWQAEDAPNPTLLVLNEALAAELAVDAEWLRSPDGVRLLAGTAVPDDATPVAQAYAGHQFGGFVPGSVTGAPSCSANCSTPTDGFAICT